MPLIALDARLVGYAMGIAQYATLLARGLADLPDGNETYLVMRGRRSSEPFVLGSRVRNLRLATPPHHRLERWTLPAEMLARGARPAVLHSIDHVTPARGPWRSVLTVHDVAFARFPETHSAESRAYYAAAAESVRRADRVIAVSQSTARDVIESLGAAPEKVRVIHEAAGPAFRPRPREELEAPGVRPGSSVDRPYLLFVGTLEARKNVVLLLEAFARVARDRDVDLWLVGAPGYRHAEILQAQARLALGERVRFLGVQSVDALAALYSHASVFVFPSLYEGFGLILLEAMACGAPVITSDAGPLPEVVGDAAIMLPPEDADAWAAAILRVLDESALRERLIQQGFARAAEFSWERAARETRDVYREVLS